jgi:hypothetical protein
MLITCLHRINHILGRMFLVNKYDIYFVLNSAYIKFGKIFLESLYDKVDMNNVRNIYLSDTGLNENDIKYVQSFDNVKVVDSGIVTNFEGGSWGKDWHDTVASKTIILKELLSNNDLPIVMVDGDCMFIDDIHDVVDDNYDIQICHRPNVPHCPYLASFVVLQPNQNSRTFLDRWIEIIDSTRVVENGLIKAKESPALGFTVSELMSQVSIGNVEFDVVSVTEAKNITDKTKIVHFKGSSISKDFEELYQKRVTSRGFEEMVDKYLKENLNLMFLCSKRYYDKKMSRVRFHSMEAISEQCNVMWWGPDWEGYDNRISVQENIDRVETKPDMIITYKPLDMKDIKSVDVPVCLRYNETYDWEWTIKEIDDSGAEFVVFHHEDDLHIPMSKYQEYYGDKIECVYVPHCAEESVYKKMDVEKEYDVLLIGATGYKSKLGYHYPLRDRMTSLLQKLSSKYRVGIWQRPPGRIDDAYNNKSAIEFATVINKTNICVTDSGLPKSRFGKYIEVPMCGTALAADIPNGCEDEFKDFIIDINMNMSDEEILNKLKFYLENPNNLRILEENGLKWSENYTQQNYAEMFINKAKEFLINASNS